MIKTNSMNNSRKAAANVDTFFFYPNFLQTFFSTKRKPYRQYIENQVVLICFFFSPLYDSPDSDQHIFNNAKY